MENRNNKNKANNLYETVKPTQTICDHETGIDVYVDAFVDSREGHGILSGLNREVRVVLEVDGCQGQTWLSPRHAPSVDEKSPAGPGFVSA